MQEPRGEPPTLDRAREDLLGVVGAPVDPASGARVLALVGEAGTGRTTLLDVLAGRFRAGGGLVLAPGAGPGRDLGLVRSLVALLIGRLAERPRSLGRPALASTLAGMLQDVVTATAPAGPIADALAALLGELGDRGPVLLAVDDLDDLEAADPRSADVVAALAAWLSAATSPLAVRLVVTARGARAVDRLSGARSLHVGPLDDLAASRLLARQPHAPRGADRLAVLDRARGNPRALVELGRGAAPRVPRAYTDLPGRTRHLLLHAALGDRDPVGAVMAAAGTAGDLAAWEPAERAGLVTLSPDGITFRDPLLPVAIRGNATLAERSAAHRRLAGVLGAEVDRRAWHRAHAGTGRAEATARSLEDTAGAAERRGGPAAAARALELAGDRTADPRERARRHAAAAVAADRFGDPDWVRALVGAGGGSPATVCPATVSPATVAAACAAANSAALCGRHDEAFEHLARVLPAIGDPAAGDPAAGEADLVGPLLHRIADASGRPAHRAALAGLRDRLGAGPAPGPAAVAHRTDESDLCVTLLRRAVAGGDGPPAVGRVAAAVVPLIEALIDTGRLAEAGALVADWTRTAELHRLPGVEADVRALGAVLAARQGDPLLAEARIRGAWPLVDLRENRATETRLLHASALAATAAGDAETAHRRLRAMFTEDGGPAHPVLSDRALAELAAAARQVDRTADAADVVARARERLGPRPTTRMRLVLHHAAALVAPDAATEERHFTLAIVDPAGQQWPLERGLSRLHYAQWLRRRRRSRDARDQLTAALETFERLGAGAPAGLARNELRATGTTVHGAGGDRLADLTPQQQQIVVLAAGGLRNREIAERLFLSPRTVGSHLHHAYPKLGVSGRHQLRDVLDDTVRPG